MLGIKKYLLLGKKYLMLGIEKYLLLNAQKTLAYISHFFFSLKKLANWLPPPPE